MIEVLAFIGWFFIGLWVGYRLAARSFAAIPKTQDAGTALIVMMRRKLLEKRQWCGRNVEITAEHTLEIGEDCFTLSLCLNADERAEA